MKLHFFLAAALLGAVGGAALAVPSDPRRDLQELNQRLDQRRRAMGGILQRENSVLHKLRQVDEALLSAAGQQQKLLQQERALTQRQQQGQEKMRQQSARAEAARRNLGAVLRRLYRQGPGGYFAFLLQSTSLDEFFVRQALLRRMLLANRSALADFRQSYRELEGEQQQRQENLAQLAQVRRELASARSRYQGERQHKETLLKLVHEQKEFYQRSIREMEEAAADLQTLIDRLHDQAGAAPAPAIPFSTLRKACPWPVQQGKIAHRFGRLFDPRLQSHVRFKGLEMRIPEGSEIRAIAAGRVAFAGWLEGYGQLLILDHGEGYFSLYSGLSRLDKNQGDAVASAEHLGLSGSTGSLTGPRLYFEIRHKGVAKDPMEWLSAHP